MIVTFEGHAPQIDPEAFVAPTAVVIGDVVIEPGANVWFGAVIRGDKGRITVGPRASVQDNVVVHVPDGGSTQIGPDCIVGHGAVLEGCRLGRSAVVGMNAVVLQGVVVGDGAMVAAGSVVMPDEVIPDGRLAAGNPARVKKAVSGRSQVYVARGSSDYRELMLRYRALGLDARARPPDDGRKGP